MNSTTKFLGLVLLDLGLCLGGCAQKSPTVAWSLKNPEVTAQLKSFIAAKTAQAQAATNAVPPEFKIFFAAAAKNDWRTVSNAFLEFRQHAGQYEHTGKTDERLRGPAWQAVLETWGALYYFNVCGEKYATAFGRGILESIPPGSIYFGGTDPGRFVVTALCKSHAKADPFFLLTQNALADSSYLDYVRGLYGGKIYTPTAEDAQRCFQDYVADAQSRLQENKLKPGEDVKVVNNQVQVSGQVAVMEINGRLTKIIFDKNPDREFFVEESFPLDWMYPHLEPHGLIMKINRHPLPRLSDDVVGQDRKYWEKLVATMMGGWLKSDTTVAQCAAFAGKAYSKHELTGFHGDPDFVRNEDAQKMFSKLRSSIAGIYVWRMRQATGPAEQGRMAAAADFAFRQAWALCPYSPEAVYRYVDFLIAQERKSEALVIATTAASLPNLQASEQSQFRTLLETLTKLQTLK